jgi:hypothetical protein
MNIFPGANYCEPRKSYETQHGVDLDASVLRPRLVENGINDKGETIEEKSEGRKRKTG